MYHSYVLVYFLLESEKQHTQFHLKYIPMQQPITTNIPEWKQISHTLNMCPVTWVSFLNWKQSSTTKAHKMQFLFLDFSYDYNDTHASY